MDHSVGTLLKQFELIEVQKLFDYRLCKSLINERIHNTNTLLNLANLTRNNSVYSVRNPERWFVPTSRTNYGNNMLSSITPRLLNTLYKNGVDIANVTPKNLLAVFL